MPLTSLRALYVEELRDLYSAEAQLLKALPRLAKGAPSTRRRFHAAYNAGSNARRLDHPHADVADGPGGRSLPPLRPVAFPEPIERGHHED